MSLLVSLALSPGCGSESPAPTPTAEQAEATGQAEQAGQAGQAETGVPVIASDEPVFDFGSLAPTQSVSHVFKLVNRGDADLHIERVERT